MTRVVCPGCGFEDQSRQLEVPSGFLASGECRASYYELVSWTDALRDPAFPHQHAVDAYAAQHAGEEMKPMTLFFALAGLHLACDRGVTGRDVQRLHQQLAQRRREWPVFERPLGRGEVVVADVVASSDDRTRLARLVDWMHDVWRLWKSDHPRVAELTRDWLG